MGIRNKILLYFSLTTIVLLSVALTFIYTLFAQYREEEYQQRQKEKITITLKFLSELNELDQDLIGAMDRLTINDLYDEKLLIFNSNRELIYSSVDDTPILFSKEMLDNLSTANKWIERKEGEYDVVAIYTERGGNAFYGISKAYDLFGYSKLNYLKYILFATFIGISVIIILVTYFLSNRITQPLIAITQKIKSYDFEIAFTPLEADNSKNEIAVLAQQFNKMMKRVNDVFSFQKHAIHHISHELKTPIAILVSNFEKMESETDTEKLQALIKHQKEDTKSLGEIINSLLEIAKTETGNTLAQEKIRIDELIFDVADELKHIHPEFLFSVDYLHTDQERDLIVMGNARLIKAALMNLMLNGVQFSHDQRVNISIATDGGHLNVIFENNGPTINERETQFLFQHFFRGENSKGKRGFGLGLVFVHKILALHGGTISYQTSSSNTNQFKITIPLS